MRFVALLSAAAVAFPVAASAQEFAGRFSGFYIGANAGGAWGRSQFKTDPGCPNDPVDAVFCNAPPSASAINGTAVAASGTGKFSSTGFTGGVQTGVSWQTGAFVYGAEGDFGAMHLRKSAAANGVFPFPFLGTQYTVTESLSADWLATLRGRLGFTVTPQLLVYVTGGAAFTDIKVSGSYSDNAIDLAAPAPLPGGTGSGSKSQLKTGWTMGGGVQWALDRNWSVKAEYLYADLGSVSAPVPLSNTANFTQTMQVRSDLAVQFVRFGVDYRF